MSSYLVVLGMGAVTWWALPAATTRAAKFWTGFAAVFLAPFSWPWLIARGHRARKQLRAEAAIRAGMREAAANAAAEQVRQDSIRWWLNELGTAMRLGDHDRADLAAETLRAIGYFDFCDCQRCRSAGNPRHWPASPMA